MTTDSTAGQAGPSAGHRALLLAATVTTFLLVTMGGVVCVTESARATAENLQLASGSVDIDEETVNMLAYQRAYEGAARVMTAIDQMLDVLINRTGMVGR